MKNIKFRNFTITKREILVSIVIAALMIMFGKKRIKNCPGIATQCRGKIVMVEPHPRFKGAWRFELNGETWVSSSWAFEEGY